MDNRSLAWFLSGLAAAGAAVCIAVACSDQPKPKCTAGRGLFAAVYEPKLGDTMGECALKGQIIGVQAYNPPNSDNTNADLSRSSIAIQGEGISAAVEAHGDRDTDPAHNPNSIGNFATEVPGSDNFCDVPTLNAAEQNLPFIPAVPPMPIPDAGPDAFTEGTPAVPGQNIKYQWSNVRVIVKASALGTQLVGDLTYTTDTTADPDAGPTHCAATYRVQALFPQIACEKTVDDAGTTAPDFCQCLPYADPDNGRAFGSGISSDLFGPQAPPEAACELSAANAAAIEAASKVTCHPDLHMCVLKVPPTN